MGFQNGVWCPRARMFIVEAYSLLEYQTTLGWSNLHLRAAWIM